MSTTDFRKHAKNATNAKRLYLLVLLPPIAHPCLRSGLCVNTLSPDVEIDGVISLTLSQDGQVVATPVSSTEGTNALTRLGGLGTGRTVRVSTRLLSGFFENPSPSPLDVTGSVSLRFTASSQRQRALRQSRSRALQESETESSFEVQVELGTETAPSDSIPKFSGAVLHGPPGGQASVLLLILLQLTAFWN